MAEGAGDYMNRGPTTPATPEQAAQMFQGKTGEQIAKEQFLDKATGDKIAAYVAQGPEGCKIVADYLRKMNNPRRTDAMDDLAEGETVVKGNVTTHTGTYGNKYQGDPDDDAKAPKVSNSKTGKKGRPTKDEKDTLQAKLPWGG